MSDPAERTETMNAYAQTYGGPDQATTTRMRQRLRARGLELETETRRRRGFVMGLVGILVVAGGGLVWSSLQSRDAPAAAATDEQGIVAAAETAQRLELSVGGALTLEPQSRVRLTEDGPERTAVELLEGSLRFAPASPSHAVDVRIGPYRVEALGAMFEARRTRGVPLVVVRRGRVRLLGPDLPPDGLRIAPEE